MAKTIIGTILVVGALLGAIYYIFGPMFGFRRRGQWEGGGEITVGGGLAVCLFVGSFGAAMLSESTVWVIPMILAWLAGFISHGRANRRHEKEADEVRKRNAIQYPGIFDSPPPEDLDTVEDEELDLYDAETCTYIGVAPKSDVRIIVERFSDLPDQGPNDVFLLYESLECFFADKPSQETIELLRSAMGKRYSLVMRWFPRSMNSPQLQILPDQ